jgi:hypothetical protein
MHSLVSLVLATDVGPPTVAVPELGSTGLLLGLGILGVGFVARFLKNRKR